MSTENAQRMPRRPALATVLVWAAFGFAVATNIWGLYAPSQPGPAMFPGFDKIAHAGSFALVTFTGLVAGLRARPLLIVLAAHAAISEIVQGTVLSGRSGDLADLVADLAGITLGWLAWRLVQRLRAGAAA